MFSALQRLLGSEAPPNKILEIKNESLGSSQVLLRDDAMVLYAPAFQQGDKKSYYEIVLQRSCVDSNTSSFSLYRANDMKEAEEKFNSFHSRVPIFVNIVKEFFNVNGLQKLCDALSEHPAWTLAHLVAYFNLVDYVSNPKFLDLMDDADYEKYMTPFQVAVKCGNIEMVKVLLPICKIDHLDNDGNSAFHYAAGTTKDIIKLISSKSTANLNHCNVDGYTPLHLACLQDKPECVKSLLFAGADVNLEAKNVSQKTYRSAAPSSAAEFLKTNANKLYIQDMKYGGTPLHWCSSRETLQALIERGCDVNAKNFDGRTALHVMVTRNRFECVVSLLSHDAEIDILDKDGNSALHLAIEKKLVNIVQCLVVFGCDFNLPNKDGLTPRHMVGKEGSGGKDDEILYILHSVGAKRCPAENSRCPPGCNFKDTYNGIPPETPEAVEQREHIQQMLATTAKNFVKNGSSSLNLPSTSSNTEFSQFGEVFNTFINACSNSKGASASSNPPHAHILQASQVDTEQEQKGHSMMDAILQMFTTPKVKAEVPSTSKQGSTETTPKEQSSPVDGCKGEKPYGKGRLLCLDGGGIRGLVLVQMLLEIERLTQTPIIYLFDWIAGTSTGGILALGLGCGKTLRQCMGLYLRMKENCFVGSRPYPSELFENILKIELGESTVMTDIKHPKLMVTGVMADRKPVDLHLFRNYKTASDILNIVTPITNRRIPPPPPEDQLVWRAARATGAAPSYFRAFGRFLDGGLIANNPTLDAMTEIHEYNMALTSVGREKEAIPISCVVSLGTGLIPVTELKEIDVFRPESIWDTAKLAYGISAIGNLLVDQATASDGRVVDRARAWCSTMGVPYYRFNPQLPEDIAMDEKSDEKLINMLWHAKAYVYSNRNKIMEMISLLK